MSVESCCGVIPIIGQRVQISYVLAWVPLPNVALTLLLPTGRIYLLKIKIVKGLYIFMAYYFVRACVSTHFPWGLCGGQRAVFAFYHVGPGDGNQIARLARTHLSLMRHVTSPVLWC